MFQSKVVEENETHMLRLVEFFCQSSGFSDTVCCVIS